jgi:hypothetical protein
MDTKRWTCAPLKANHSLHLAANRNGNARGIRTRGRLTLHGIRGAAHGKPVAAGIAPESLVNSFSRKEGDSHNRGKGFAWND